MKYEKLERTIYASKGSSVALALMARSSITTSTGITTPVPNCTRKPSTTGGWPQGSR